MTESIFDLNGIRQDLDATEWESDEDGGESRSAYLGTCFALLPSGKYYTPFANSNVTEADAAADAEWFEHADAELETVGASLESGSNDPCDLFATEHREER